MASVAPVEADAAPPPPCPRAAAAAHGGAASPSGVKGITKITTVEGIAEYRVDSNGFRVLLFPDATKPTITVNMTYLVGSRMENYGETGMAHLLEHMMFKGTPKHPHIDQEYNQRGARFNGSTAMDRTNYYEITRASDDNLAWALEMESDRMVHSFIARKDLDSEMTVVRNEYEMGENSPFSVLMKRLQSVMYDWHSYGRATIGNRSDIENVPIERLQAFYHLYYQPDNAVLMVAGKFDEKKALALVAKYFGPIPKPRRALPKFWTVEPTQDGDRIDFTVRRKGDIQIVMVGYHVPSNLHEESDPLGFASSILGSMPTGRLHKALVEKGLASQVFSIPIMGVDPGILIFGAVVKKGEQLDPVQKELTRVVETFADEPPTPEEIERTRQLYANQAEKTLDNMESIGVEMSEYIALGDWRLLLPGARRAAHDHFRARGRRGQAILQARQPHHRHLHARGQPSARRDPARADARRGDEGLPSLAGDVGGRGVRSVAGQHRQAHAAHQGRRRERGAPAEEDPRRHGARLDRAPHGQREGALRPAGEREPARPRCSCVGPPSTRAASLPTRCRS